MNRLFPISRPRSADRTGGSLRAFCAMVSVCILASCAARESAQSDPGPLSAHIQLTTNRVYVGDVFEARLQVWHPAGSAVQLPELSREKALVVRHQASRQAGVSDARIRTDVHLQLSSFVIGHHVLSTGWIECVTAEGESLKQEFPFAAVEVASSLAGADERLRDIKAPARWPGAVPRWLWGLLIIALVAALAGFAARRFLSRPPALFRPPPPPPPHEIALQRLRELRARGWIESMNVEPFYVEVSDIVRQYIENRFDLRAPEMTTEEFIRAATESRRLNESQQSLTAGFLEQSDLVKFARYRPERSDMEGAHKAAETLVLETAPKAGPAAERSGA